MDLVSRRHLTKDIDLNVIIIILIAAMRIHETTQEEKRPQAGEKRGSHQGNLKNCRHTPCAINLARRL